MASTIILTVVGCASPRTVPIHSAPTVALTAGERRLLVYLIDKQMAAWPRSTEVCLAVTDGSAGALPPDSLLTEMVSRRHELVKGQTCESYSVGMRVLIPRVGAAAPSAPSDAQRQSHKVVVSRPVRLANGDFAIEWQDEHEGTVFAQDCRLRENGAELKADCGIVRAINF